MRAPEAPPTRRLAGTEPALRGPLHVVVLSGDQLLSHTLPERGEVTIGRAEDATLRLDDPSVSRHHAILHVGEIIELEDLGSANGTLAGRTRIASGQRVELQPGDSFQVGHARLILQTAANAPPPRLVWSHGYFEGRLVEECARAGRDGAQFAVARLCVSGASGDHRLAAVVGSVVRTADVLASYGPREYEILLVQHAADEAERAVARLVAELKAQGVTAATRLAAFPRDGRTPEALLDAVSGLGQRSPGDPIAPPIVVEDESMKRLYVQVRRIAAGDVHVLVLGETGAGKEVVAEELHRQSPRAAKPLLRLNCAALPGTLLESELMGHERGAFTGADRAKPGLLETATGGTVLLDEVGELPLTLQAKLLRVVDAQEVLRVGGLKPIPIDVRFVAATNQDLQAAVARGGFRRDLFFRLAGAVIQVPPLRARPGEIVSLASVFAADAAHRLGRPRAPEITLAARQVLDSYPWPGNVRELRNVIVRAVLLSPGDVIGPEHLPVDTMSATIVPAAAASGAAVATSIGADPAPAGQEVADRERILAALEACAGNQTRAARMLGISRGTLVARLEHFGVPRPRKPVAPR